MRGSAGRGLAALLVLAAGCERGQAPLAPPQFSSAAWPNEPAGLALLSDYRFDDSIPSGANVPLSDGWLIWNPAGYATHTSDTGAPGSPPGVGQWRYPVDFAGGQAPATMYHELGPPASEMYFGYWWKASAPWQGHPSGVNEISFLVAPGNILVVQMNGPPGGPYHLIVTTEFTTSNGHLDNSEGDDPGARNLFGNVNGGNYVVTPGQWYQIEAHVKTSTTSTSRDGMIQWWVNGTLVGDYTTVNFDVTQPWEEFQLSPNWGGVGGTKSEEDYFWYDHVLLSAGGGAPPPPGDLTVTTTTSGLSLDPDGYAVTVDSGPTQPIPVNGRVTFPGLAAGDHTVTLSDVAPNCVVSDGQTRTVTVPSGGTASTTFSVTCVPGAATHLVFTVQPSNALPYPVATIQPPVKVSVLDEHGNTVTSFTGQVTIAVGRNAGTLMPGTLRGTQTVSAVNGVATFSDLSIDQPGRGYTLRVAAPALAGAESVSFDILATP